MGVCIQSLFQLVDVSSPFFLTKRIDNRRSGIQNIELVLLCVWMKYKNVVMFYFIVVRVRYCVFV